MALNNKVVVVHDSTGNELSVSAGGAVKVDASATTQPVSGTVTANIGTSGSLALDATLIGGTQKTKIVDTGGTNVASVSAAGAVKVDGSAVTQPVSAASLPLPTGAATETTLAKIPIAQASTTSGQSGALVQGAVTTAAPTYTTAQTSPLSLTTAGALRTDASGTTQPISGTVTANAGTNLNTSALALDATLSAQSLVDNAAFTDGTSRVVPSGYVLDEVAGTALSENDIAAARVDSKRAQVLVIEDATTRGTRATIKAASTAAVATDPALVVALSPNNPVTVSAASDVTASGTLGALNAAVTVTHPGLGSVGMQLNAGTFAGILTAECSHDGGTTWSAVPMRNSNTDFKSVSWGFINPNAATNLEINVAGGAGMTRVRVSTYTSGTANANIRASNINVFQPLFSGAPSQAIPPSAVLMGGSDSSTFRALTVDSSGRPNVVGAAASGSAVAGNPLLVGGSDGTNARQVATDSNGAQYIATLAEMIARARVSSAFEGSIAGDVSTNALTKVLIGSTTFTEQTTGAQRSVSSASANDSSAGTGARTIKLTYYTVSGATISGPSTETITMNGTTAVNTVATNIAFVEKIEVMTVGSTLSNVGIISLFTTTAGGGSAFATIAATTNTTRLAHHYVASGRTCMLYEWYIQNDTSSGNNPKFSVEVVDPTSANNAEKPAIVGRVDGRSSAIIGKNVPVAVVGPARIRVYITPANTPIQVSTTDIRFVEI